MLVHKNQVRISTRNNLVNFVHIYSQICYLNTRTSEDFNIDKLKIEIFYFYYGSKTNFFIIF